MICCVDIARASMGGIVSVQGVGWGANATVMIGGRPVEIVRRSAGNMSVRVPGNAGGGGVEIQDNGRTISCGNLSISSR